MNIQVLFPLIILLLFIPIFLNGRKQKQQVQQMQQLQNSLSDGDVVTTTSGLRGTVVDSSYDDTIDLEIAPGVVTTWQRAAIREKLDPTAVGAEAHRHETGTPALDGQPVDGKPVEGAEPRAEAQAAPATDPAPGRSA